MTSLKYERDSGAVFVDFPSTLRSGPALHHRFLLLRESRGDRPVRRASPSRRIPSGRTGSTPRAKDIGASIWWPNKDQWRDEVENMEISVAIPNDLVDVSNGKFIGQDRSWRWLHALGLAGAISDQQLRRLAEHRQLRALRRPARRSAARFLRSARRSGESQEAVCAGQGHARGLTSTTSANIRSRKTATS